MRKTKCEGCGRQAPTFEVVEYGSMEAGFKQLCRRCFNSEAATICVWVEHLDARIIPPPAHRLDAGGVGYFAVVERLRKSTSDAAAR